ncbi:Type 1 glutamine amidotransferase-like domain-containing protein, partial [Burkholderia sp. SIMBA_042]
AALERAAVIIVGGGNTFNLLGELRRRGLLSVVARRVREGAAYLGWSAGSNLACPSICTTNDMPITDPAGFDALGLL